MAVKKSKKVGVKRVKKAAPDVVENKLIGTKIPLDLLFKDAQLKEARGQRLVLYFYPKDNTSGCTKEACDFRDLAAQFKKSGTLVVGVSPDNDASHAKFRDKFDLNFPLIADIDKKLCHKFGVWVEKSMYGRKYMGVLRSTFVLDADGRVEQVWSKVKVDGHAAEVLQAVKQKKS